MRRLKDGRLMRATVLVNHYRRMECNTLPQPSATGIPTVPASSADHATQRPMWQRPSISLLEVETGTLTGGGGASEGGFTHS